MSVKELPLTNFKIALGECTDRLKVCSSLSVFIDDFTELENNHGKSLTKLGTQTVSVGSKVDWFPTYSSVWENAYKSLTASDGKQHSTLSSNLSQNISKKYPEFVKVNKKRLATVSSKIAGLIDDLKKAKQVHNKNIEKYLKLIQDAEAMVRSRATPNDTTADPQRTASVPSESEAATTTAKDNSFMNRSLNKMLSKIAPTEKKTQERMKDILKEIEGSENSIALNVTRINNMRLELLSEISRGMVEIEEMESSRLTLMKDGLSRVSVSVDLLVEKQSEASEALQQQTNKLNSKEEMTSSLMKEIDKLVAVAISNKKKDSEESVEGFEVSNSEEALELLTQAEKMSDAMEFLRLMAVKVTNGLLEIADVERAYAKAASKLLEKHGFTASGEFSPSIKSGATNSNSCSESLQQLESPLLLAAWQCVIRSVSNMSESHLNTSETLSEEICQKLDSIQKQIDIGKKELAEQWSNSNKKYEAAHSNHEKLMAKLVKSQAVLKERKNAVKVAKDELRQGVSGTAVIVTEGDIERDSETEDAPTPTAVVEDKKERKSSMVMRQGLENLGNTLTKSKLKQVVGLETPADRITRIEKQIITLEEEESELISSLKMSQANCTSVDLAVKSELSAALSAAKNILTVDLDTMKGTLDVFMSWHGEANGLTKTCSLNIKQLNDKVIVASDLKSFVDVIRTAAQTASVTDVYDNAASCQVLLDIPSVEVFEAVKSDILDEERRSHGAAGSAFASVVHSAVKQHQNGAAPPLHPKEAHNSHPHVDIAAEPLAVDTAPEVNNNINNNSIPPSVSISAASSPVLDSPLRPHTELPSSPSYEVNSDAATLLSATSTPTTSKKLAESLHESVDPVDSTAAPLQDITVKLFDEYFTGDKEGEASAEVSGQVALNDSLSMSSSSDNHTLPAVTSGEATPNSPAPPNNSIGIGNVVSNTNSLASVAAALMAQNSAAKPVGGDTFELAKFGLSAADKVLESFSCALYPKKGLLTHGRMFVTQHYLAFSGWPDTKVLLALSHVKSIEKSNTMGYIPNALTLTTENGEEYFFGSFIDRLPCYTLLTNLSEIAKRIIVIQGPNAVPEVNHAGLEFGYQSRNNLFGGFTAAAAQFMETEESSNANSSVAATPIAPSRSLISGTPSLAAPIVTASSPASPVIKPAKDPSVSTLDTVSVASLDTSNREALLSPSVNYDDIVSQKLPPPTSASTSVSGSAKTAKSFPASKKSVVPKPVLPQFSEELPPDSINVNTFFADKGITLLGEKTFDFSTVELFRAYFLEGRGYGDFLFSEGDLDIEVGEWKPMSKSLVPEDISKLHFSHSRPYSYAHPRTTMLMFGPKNAPGTQVQYLYLPHDISSDDGLKSVRPKRGIILNITQFDGIPMADVFKVLQYWTFMTHPTDSNKTVVKVGLAMHYIKSSMFKSQIFGGTKDELSDQLKKWFVFIVKRVEDYIDRAKELGDAEEEEEYEEESNEASGETDVVGDPLIVNVGLTSRRKSFEDASVNAAGSSSVVSRPASRRLSHSSANFVSQSYPAAPPPVATAAPVAPAKDLNKAVLVGVLLVFFVLILIQWSYNRSLSRQITVLNAKFDLSQQKNELFVKESQALIEKLLKHLNVK